MIAATWGLLLAWAIHDAEEAATMGGWVDRARPQLQSRFPWVPDRAWDRLRVTPPQARIAVAAMGAAAAARGARTGGRSSFYQAALAGFGLHAATHIGQSVALRSYTPGVVTAPLVVAPFSLWAWRHLSKAGVPRAGGKATVGAAVLLPVAAAACHALARALAPEQPGSAR